MDVLRVGTASSHGSQNDPVLEVRGTNADGVEKLRDSRGHLLFLILVRMWVTK